MILRWLAVVLFAASCAWIVWRAVWLYYPASYRTLSNRGIVEFLTLTSGPLLAAGLSLIALWRRSPHGVWTRFFVGALVTVCFIVTWFATGLSIDDTKQSDMPLNIGALLFAARLFVGTVSIVVPNRALDWKRQRGQHRLIVASLAAPLLGLPLWSITNIPLVAWRARTAADSAPYCIQVPIDSVREAPVTHWGQLAGLRMRSPFEWGGVTSFAWQFRYHSILVVKRNAEDRFYNWSYALQNFVPITEPALSRTHVSAKCEPKPGFLHTLDLF